ncbi:hypothetical protein M405DRAFT_386065 [Rhizopogon salebrosus TDB-379]|nr:hypothetical protein M405DRAFT_386065 [Rhizopogon salebrosus TDB-379]
MERRMKSARKKQKIDLKTRLVRTLHLPSRFNAEKRTLTNFSSMCLVTLVDSLVWIMFYWTRHA